jgi:hypothetical protein
MWGWCFWYCMIAIFPHALPFYTRQKTPIMIKSKFNRAFSNYGFGLYSALYMDRWPPTRQGYSSWWNLNRSWVCLRIVIQMNWHQIDIRERQPKCAGVAHKPTTRYILLFFRLGKGLLLYVFYNPGSPKLKNYMSPEKWLSTSPDFWRPGVIEFIHFLAHRLIKPNSHQTFLKQNY